MTDPARQVDVAAASVCPAALLPGFVPHRLFRGGHAQTIAGAYWPGRPIRYRATQHIVNLPDGDQLVAHDDCPDVWRPGDRAALLIHGLAGNHLSGYMRRGAQRLAARGVRVFRLDLRGCGAGFALARWPYHSGRSEDAAAVLKFLAGICPGSPVTLIGFSLGGNITLKLLGELGDRACGGLDSGIAVCPPIDLAACSQRISSRQNRYYDEHFVRMLSRSVRKRRRLRADVPALREQPRVRTLAEFDDAYTAPVSGFGTAANYYALASSRPLVPMIRRSTLIIAADDDPMIPGELFVDLPRSDWVQTHITRGGGHLGFIGRRNGDRDRRWLDWRIVDWIAGLDR